MQMAEKAFMRQATSPRGIWLQSHPSIAYVGNPVGWKIERVCGTVWASAVSQNPSDGSRVLRKTPNATTETAAAVQDSSPSAYGRAVRRSRGSANERSAGRASSPVAATHLSPSASEVGCILTATLASVTNRRL